MNYDLFWPENDAVLRLAQRTDRCSVLGPGVRAVLWVQGCPFRCPGCVAPETLPFAGGTEMAVDTLAGELTALQEVEGVTFSGGEPMAQAAALCRLIDRIRSARDMSFLCYTGYTLEILQRCGSDAQRGLLARLDVLIDGPYDLRRHTDLRWRGSDNQRVLLLTQRYRHLAQELDVRGTWIEFELGRDGSLIWMGIPPQGFRESVPLALRRLGIHLAQGDTSHE
jgi:anaerobic ribonucleoside-triphosphate reductase activating protein